MRWAGEGGLQGRLLEENRSEMDLPERKAWGRGGVQVLGRQRWGQGGLGVALTLYQPLLEAGLHLALWASIVGLPQARDRGALMPLEAGPQALDADTGSSGSYAWRGACGRGQGLWLGPGPWGRVHSG